MPARFAGNGDATCATLKARGDVIGEQQARRRAPSAAQLDSAVAGDGLPAGGSVLPQAAAQPMIAAGSAGPQDGGNLDKAAAAVTRRTTDAPAAAPVALQPAATTAADVPRQSAPQVRGCTGLSTVIHWKVSTGSFIWTSCDVVSLEHGCVALCKKGLCSSAACASYLSPRLLYPKRVKCDLLQGQAAPATAQRLGRTHAGGRPLAGGPAPKAARPPTRPKAGGAKRTGSAEPAAAGAASAHQPAARRVRRRA